MQNSGVVIVTHITTMSMFIYCIDCHLKRSQCYELLALRIISGVLFTFVGRGRYNDSGHTYFAKVKKCPQCHQPMEKSGGCQHMACRCGASFCWECLCLWQDHGPYLVCPRSHVSITVISGFLSPLLLECGS